MVRISAALIVRNEEAFLPACLQSLQPIVDEIVLVDTGSQDQTVALAGQFASNIYTFEWKDDFALARNFSLDKATGDYVLVADADHRVVNPENGRHLLERFAGEHSPNTLGTVAILSGVRDESQTREEVSISPKFFRRENFVFDVDPETNAAYNRAMEDVKRTRLSKTW
ncbi:MAG: glycosyltransferase, partial [Candidatus Hydrogenedentota bacterium]